MYLTQICLVYIILSTVGNHFWFPCARLPPCVSQSSGVNATRKYSTVQYTSTGPEGGGGGGGDNTDNNLQFLLLILKYCTAATNYHNGPAGAYN